MLRRVCVFKELFQWGNLRSEIMGTTSLGHLFVCFDLIMLHKQKIINSEDSPGITETAY